MKKILLSVGAGILLLGSQSFAQVGLYNAGTLAISTATDTLFISGNFTNESTAVFTNTGVLQVKQNLVNNQASMSAGTGILYLNGTATQTVSGTQVFKTFNLATNNAAGIVLNNNLSVSGIHTYIAGLITTAATPNYMIYEAGSSYTGSSDTRHVYGWVKKLGNTDFVFPVGNASYLRAVALTNLTATAEFNVKHNHTVTPNRYSLYNPLVYVDSAEYWTINKISGAAARIAMNWDNSKIAFPNLMISDVKAVYYDGVFWRSIGGTATGSALTTGNVTSNSVTAFNTNFGFGSVSYVLPVKIISFTAQRKDGYSKINWTIGNELNVYNYELQRSDDGINFYPIHIHQPYNRNSTEFYGYDDSRILQGTAFYRLKINNTGGQVNYSQTVAVSANDHGRSMYVIANPVDASIDLYADADVTGVYNYTIANTSGQIMQQGTLDIKHAGVHAIYLKPVFAPGTYILVVQNDVNRLQKTIIKK